MCIGLARPGSKGEFLKWWLMLFLSPLRWNDACWPQQLVDILFAATPWVLVVFWHDLGLGGCSAIVAIVLYDREVGCACLIFLRVAFIFNSKYLGKKDLCKNYNTSWSHHLRRLGRLRMVSLFSFSHENCEKLKRDTIRNWFPKTVFDSQPYRLGGAHISMFKALEIRNFPFLVCFRFCTNSTVGFIPQAPSSTRS